jgi:RNA polymerase sigma factor (sigma-70 family)
MVPHEFRRQLDTLWRMESPRLVARIARITGDVASAEDLAQDVLVTAMERWPVDGLPDNPAAWWMAAAKRRALDHLRGRATHARREAEYAVELDVHRPSDADEMDARADDRIGDDLLRLAFATCHPVLPVESQVALTLKLLCGLQTGEIARAFLASEATIAQRIVRAKRTLSEAGVPFEVPRADALAERLAAVLRVVYLVFNEGYSATAGDDWMRPQLCEDAQRLGRVLAGLMPREPEVHGLLALMELQASRLRARTAADGSPVLLLDQDRARWDRLLVRRGLEALDRAVALGGADGPYALQAAIAACHARAARPDDTDWTRIAALYARLADAMPSPVVELNRAVAEAMAFGPLAGLARIEALRDDAALRDYHLLPSVRGDLLEKLGRRGEARAEFERASALTRNARERGLLMARALACTGDSP